MPGAALPGNLANSAVVLAAVLGSRIVEISVVMCLIIRGPRASRLAMVGRRDRGLMSCICFTFCCSI